MKTRYRLSCPCGQEHLVETTQAGNSLRCKCGATLEVPTMQGLKRLPRVEEGGQPESRRGSWGLRHQLVLAGIVIAAIGLVLFGYVYRQRPPRWENRPRWQNMDELTPYQSLTAWADLKSGPEAPPDPANPLEKQITEIRRQNDQRLKASGGVIALGVLVMASSLVAPRPKAEDSDRSRPRRPKERKKGKH